nr:hypothetical protein [Rhizobium halophytocola]
MTANFEREGPGIPKDAPKKTGLALFGQIVLREWWELFKLNIAIIVFSLPLVTMPAAFAASIRVCNLMVEDENVYLMREFRAAFLGSFLKATTWGFGLLIVLGLFGYACYVYGQLALHAPIYVLPFALALATSLFAWIVAVHLFVLMVRAPSLSPAALLHRAVVAGLSRPLPALGALAFTSSLWLLHVILYPASVFMPAAFNFSLAALAIVFSVHRSTDFALALRLGRTRDGEKVSQKAPGRT